MDTPRPTVTPRIADAVRKGYNVLIIQSDRVDGPNWSGDQNVSDVHRTLTTSKRITPKMVRTEVAACARHQRGSVRRWQVSIHTRENVTPRQYQNLFKASHVAFDVLPYNGKQVCQTIRTSVTTHPDN